MRKLVLAALLSLASAPALAYRPFDSTDAAVAQPRALELEIGPIEWLREERETFVVFPRITANYGFAAGWEVVLEGRHTRRIGGDDEPEPRSRIEDTGLFIKHVVREGALQDKEGWSLAIEAGPLLPTIHAESGVGVSGALIASRRVGAATTHINGTIERTRDGHLAVTAGAILEGDERRALRPVAEIVVEREEAVGTTTSLLGGAIYRTKGDIAIDAAVRLARVGSANAIEIRAGVTFALFGRGERETP